MPRKREAPSNPRASRWPSRPCTAVLHGRRGRRTVSPTRTTADTFPPASGVSSRSTSLVPQYRDARSGLYRLHDGSVVAGDDHQMRAQAEQRRLAFDRTDSRQEAFALGLILPPFGERLRNPPAGTLDPHGLHDRPARITHLGLEFFRMMKKRSREVPRVVLGIAVLSIPQVLLDDASEHRVMEEAGGQPVEQRGEATDADSQEPAAATRYPPCFPQRLEAVGTVRQVIERSHE